MKKSGKRNPLKLTDQVRTRREYIDYDYADQLSPEELEFLKKFTDEFYGGAVEIGNKNDLHYHEDEDEYKRLRRDCYNRNNRQNRDILGLAKATGKLDILSDAEFEVFHQKKTPSHSDDAKIELIDRSDEILEQLNNKPNKTTKGTD